ncbi:heavy-metal-associated domain-containing protein [Nocardia suismassiliense]|uniref:heavy-metal-associated domain-containing protein n=1 Tax=Nocardia suismassiliense TaxID=2077092 RepID=UPI000D1DA33A|nr:heavy metal-associated domain-containing protein [Nocardia suismassiliense]
MPVAALHKQTPRQIGGGPRGAWAVYAIAVVIGLFAPPAVPRSCDYLLCREAQVSSATWVTLVGVIIVLVTTGVMMARSQGRLRLNRALMALAGVVLTCCGSWALMAAPLWDERPALGRETAKIEAALGRMPGVHTISINTHDTFSAVVVLTEEASADQTKAVVQAFRDQTTGAKFRQWEIDIEVRHAATESSFKVGKAGFDQAPDRAARWFALHEAFPRAAVKWTNHTWAFFFWIGQADNYKNADIGIGDISLKLLNTNGFNAVDETYRRLMREFPDLSGARWDVGDLTGTRWNLGVSAPGSGSLAMTNRYPTELELSVWNRLNEDQSLPHAVLMNPVFGVIERPHSTDPHTVELLAEKHLPIVAELGGSVRYMAVDNVTPYVGNPINPLHHTLRNPGGPLNITIGGCTSRDYTPGAAEQKLADRYEKC